VCALGLVVCLAALPGHAQVDAGERPALNVVIASFDPGVPEDRSSFRELQIFPRIREIEAHLIPFLLRETLVQSGEWGAVRVVPEIDEAAELQVRGTIVESNGIGLSLRIAVTDAAGSVWIDEVFSSGPERIGESNKSNKKASLFIDLYREISEFLLAARDARSAAELRAAQGISLMRYAVTLAPSAFAGFLQHTADGQWRLLRLPATNDPMLQRIEMIRDTEFLITDTVDAKYRELSDELSKTYDAWREYRLKFAGYEAENRRYAAANSDDAPRGSWEAIKDQYEIYKYDRITAQEQDRLAIAFNNEVGPTVEAMEARVAELEGWVETGYEEWRRLLEELYEVETLIEQ